MSTFNKPCIFCGKLARQTPCPECKRVRERTRDQQRDADPIRRAKKAALYDTTYRKKRELLKKRGGICYLCGEIVPPLSGQADHLIPGDPESPLAITHSFCNQSRGNKTFKG